MQSSDGSGTKSILISPSTFTVNGVFNLPATIGNPNQVLVRPNSSTTTLNWVTPYNEFSVWRGFTFNNNSTTVQTDGGLTASASASTLAQSVSSTDFVSRQIRLRYYASIVATGRYTGLRGSSLLWYISGGFRFVCDVNISDTAYGSTCQQFYGLAGQTTDLAYGGVSLVQLSTLTNLVGIGSEASDTNLQVFYNDATGTCTKINLGASFPANRTAGASMTTVYSIVLFNEPGDPTINYYVKNNETGVVASGNTGGSNLPATTQGLNIFASRTMGTPTTNTGQFDLCKLGCFSLL